MTDVRYHYTIHNTYCHDNSIIIDWATCHLSLLGESIQSLMVQSAKHGSQCSAPSELIQRAVVRHTKLIKTVEKGIFCDVHVGQWRTEHVSVKVYLAKDKKLWFAESQIFQVSDNCMHYHSLHTPCT